MKLESYNEDRAFFCLTDARKEMQLVDIDKVQRCYVGRQKTSAKVNSELRHST